MDSAQSKAEKTKGTLGQLSGATQTLQSRFLGATVSGVGFGAGLGALNVGVGALSGVIKGTIGTAANFERAVDQVGAVSLATADEMKGISKEALDIGKNTAFGATEAAGAMEILAANGVAATDIIEGATDATVALAAAGGTDLKLAADVASTSMSVWKLKTEQMTDVVNRLAGAANVSRFGVEDMAQAVAQGGGAAATAGVEFGDFATAIAAIAPNFSSGSDAGTSFKTFLVGLQPTSEKATGMMKDLGLITKEAGNRFFDAQGNLKSMADVTQILHDATAGLSEQQKIEALQTIFGTDAMRAAAAMAERTGAEFAAMNTTMKNTDAAAVAAMRMDNFKGSLEQLKGSIETLSIQIGMKFLPVLTDVTYFLATAIPSAVEDAEPYLKLFATGMGLIFDVIGPGAQLLAEHAELVRGIAIAWGVFKAAQIAGAVLSASAAIASSTLEMKFAAQAAMGLRLAMLGVAGAFAGFVLPEVIKGISGVFGKGKDNSDKFAESASKSAAALQELGGAADAVAVQRLTNDLSELGHSVVVAFGEGRASIAGMVQGAIDAGATFEEAMKMIRDAGVENLPEVQRVMEDLRVEQEKNRVAAQDVALEQKQVFIELETEAVKAVGAQKAQQLQLREDAKETSQFYSGTWGPVLETVFAKVAADGGGSMDSLRANFPMVSGDAETMQGILEKEFGEDAAKMFKEWNDDATEKFEGVKKAFGELLPDVTETFDEWEKRLKEDARLQSEWEGNLTTIYQAITASGIKMPAELLSAITDKGPRFAEFFSKQFAENPQAALDTLAVVAPQIMGTTGDSLVQKILAAQGGMSTAAWAALHDPVTGAVSGLGTDLEGVGSEAGAGFIRGLESKRAEINRVAYETWGVIPDDVRELFGSSSPSKVFMRIGADVMEGFRIGIETASKAAEAATGAIAARITGRMKVGGVTFGASVPSALPPVAMPANLGNIPIPVAPLPSPRGFDAGGFLMPGLTLAMNNTSRPEPVLTQEMLSRLVDRPQQRPVVNLNADFRGAHLTGTAQENERMVERVFERLLDRQFEAEAQQNGAVVYR